MSHVTHVNEPCHESRMRHGTHTHMNESCRTYERAMSHIWMSHVTYVLMHKMRSPTAHLDLSAVRTYVCHTYESGMSRTWTTYDWDQSPFGMSDNTHINESRRTALFSFIRETWMSHMANLEECAQLCVSHIWITHKNDMSVRSATHMNESCCRYGWVMSHTWTTHIAHSLTH